MKKLLTCIGVAATLVACKYPSHTEALNACKEWSEGGGYYTENFLNAYVSKIIEKMTIRHCIEDKPGATRVILGYVYDQVRNGDTIYELRNKGPRTIQKRFFY